MAEVAHTPSGDAEGLSLFYTYICEEGPAHP